MEKKVSKKDCSLNPARLYASYNKQTKISILQRIITETSIYTALTFAMSKIQSKLFEYDQFSKEKIICADLEMIQMLEISNNWKQQLKLLYEINT